MQPRATGLDALTSRWIVINFMSESEAVCAQLKSMDLVVARAQLDWQFKQVLYFTCRRHSIPYASLQCVCTVSPNCV
jgi:hypothetical protein